MIKESDIWLIWPVYGSEMFSYSYKQIITLDICSKCHNLGLLSFKVETDNFSHPLAFPSSIIVAVAVTKNIFAITNNTGQNVSLLINLVYYGDVKAWQKWSQADLIASQPSFSCEILLVDGQNAQWKQGL